ncbi:MAG: hypothetical protein HC800_04675 [Phormidesmis sp. RL_2_1]|nr:hypothetical protein [Phormidesmis sp. RL_2_1]
MSLITRLENYTLKFPQEMLLIQAQIGDEVDQIIVFKGFSSSLMRPTAYDPDVAVLPESAVVECIDRLQAPYQPADPKYLEQGLALDIFLGRLAQLGL